MKAVKTVGIQYAALPFRIERRRVQVLLITSRATRRWVIPKGWPIPGLTPKETAAREAADEAGLAGEVADQPIGSFHYAKRLKGDHDAAVQVIVFPFQVEAQFDDWKEQHQRIFCWLDYRRAAMMVAEPGLGRLIRDLGLARSPGLLARGVRIYQAWRTLARRPALG
ncbi:MAG TPA: NUDIX hydrolase [Caulobacteraceae bacterium]|jgi:8-oxo-dGTP pyrophosphatase MutT (NUDIX family)|nr:NUDIX hydrolase [Caulobacteraceae bacterium]